MVSATAHSQGYGRLLDVEPKRSVATGADLTRDPFAPRQHPIPLHQPTLSQRELSYVARVLQSGSLASDGPFSQRCRQLLEKQFGIHAVLMTPSCTAALEMALMLCDIEQGDEVLMPSFTFTSTATAVLRAGGRPVFTEICRDTMNMDVQDLAARITPHSRVVLPVHYAGACCDMDQLQCLAAQHRLRVVEDAAQAVNSYYKGQALGSLGDLAAFSFHDTKNFACGEGGALCINDPRYVERAHILRDKGTNRRNYLDGIVDRYTWVDIGSSFVPSEIACAVLLAQLERMSALTFRRRVVYQRYQQALAPLAERGLVDLPIVPACINCNAHLFYMLLPSQTARDDLMQQLRFLGIGAAFHYVPLHLSPMGQRLGSRRGDLPVTEDVASRLLRLPLYSHMTSDDQEFVIRNVGRILLRPRKSNRKRRPTPSTLVPKHSQDAATPRSNVEASPGLEILEWDSQQFGLSVARLDSGIASDVLAERVLADARRKAIHLVYWTVPADRHASTGMLESYRGRMVDQRVTFERELKSAGQSEATVRPAGIHIWEHSRGPATIAMKELALRAGRFSRFHMDPFFPQECFQRLYSVWIERSAKREIADVVLLARTTNDSEAPDGMITASIDGASAQIGLIAVREEVGRCGIGGAMMRRLADWLTKRHISRLRVCTQLANQAACRFYERCGFRRIQFEHVYHFWPCEPQQSNLDQNPILCNERRAVG